MKKYIILIILMVAALGLVLFLGKGPMKQVITKGNKQLASKPVKPSSSVPVVKIFPKQRAEKQQLKQSLDIDEKSQPIDGKSLAIKSFSFNQLPGWKTAKVSESFSAFKLSCKTFLKQAPEQSTGSSKIPLKAKDFQPACLAAMELSSSDEAAKSFFETWFNPVEFYKNKPVEGLFTGYYAPLIKGSLKRTAKYTIPLYDVPKDLITAHLKKFNKTYERGRIVGRVDKSKLVPYYERKEINQGALKNKAKVIAWIADPVDQQFLEIQGSGLIELDNGQRIYVGYSEENGQPYTSLAKILIDKGIMTRDNASMQGIKRYFNAHPEKKSTILNQNKSFVFFTKLDNSEAYGSQGVALTPGYSLAIDRKYVPMGAPVWLNTTSPGEHSDAENNLQRLMIAQDTGGAIKGPVRGDVYWGAGKKATYIAGHMKNKGHYWLLLPKHAMKRIIKS